MKGEKNRPLLRMYHPARRDPTATQSEFVMRCLPASVEERRRAAVK